MIGRTVGPVSSVGRAPELQAGGHRFGSCIRHTFSSLVYFNGDKVNWCQCGVRLETDGIQLMPCTKVKRGRNVVIGRTVGLVSSVGRAPDLQAGGH